MQHLVFIVLGALTLAACQHNGETPPNMAETCGAETLQHLLGKPQSALESAEITGPTRILPPGSMMTMDHRPDRLNVDLDDSGRINRIWCG